MNVSGSPCYMFSSLRCLKLRKVWKVVDIGMVVHSAKDIYDLSLARGGGRYAVVVIPR